MGRKRPWQAIMCLVLPDENKVNSKSFLTHEEAIAWGIEWMQAHGPDNPFSPAVEIAHRDALGWPGDELAPETYRLQWIPDHKVMVQITWPVQTPTESMIDAMQAVWSNTKMRRRLKVVAVAPGGDESMLGEDLGEMGG